MYKAWVFFASYWLLKRALVEYLALFIHFPVSVFIPPLVSFRFPNASSFCDDSLNNSRQWPMIRCLKWNGAYHCSFVLGILTSPFHEATLEAAARSHMAGGSGANRCPAGLRTKTGQCFRLVAKTGTNRFLHGANLFFSCYWETTAPLFNPELDISKWSCTGRNSLIATTCFCSLAQYF